MTSMPGRDKKIDQLDYDFNSASTESVTYYELRDYPRLIWKQAREG
jgi:hypothetical protein